MLGGSARLLLLEDQVEPKHSDNEQRPRGRARPRLASGTAARSWDFSLFTEPFLRNQVGTLNLHDSLTGVASHGRILIAEDDDLTLELLATVLRRENYEVVT